ncbi:MAG: hypothetical protein E6Q99_01225 [Elusimicrobia bacterium]|nr:MAG: hypothetical protein E6Q99_01225 [Elusimicrobiota bacterium]
MLNRYWASTPAFDLELKRYQLLAFLQRVQRGFEADKLYPYLTELRLQVADLRTLQKGREASHALRQGDVLGIDLRNAQLLRRVHPDPMQLEVVDELVAMALPDLQQRIHAGEELRRTLLNVLELRPVGLQPMHQYEGWLLLRDGGEARAYTYSIPWMVSSAAFDPATQVRTHYVTSFSWGPTSQMEHVRRHLEQVLPSPFWVATYALESERRLPRMETLLPLARHLLFERIAELTGPDGRTRPSATEGNPSH